MKKHKKAKNLKQTLDIKLLLNGPNEPSNASPKAMAKKNGMATRETQLKAAYPHESPSSSSSIKLKYVPS